MAPLIVYFTKVQGPAMTFSELSKLQQHTTQSMRIGKRPTQIVGSDNLQKVVVMIGA